jgi:cysteinyl-tRNA synthetase
MSKSVGNTVRARRDARPRPAPAWCGTTSGRPTTARSSTTARPRSTRPAPPSSRIDGFLAKGQARLRGRRRSAGDLPEAFGAAMDDDLNIPQALAVLHESVRAGNTALAAGDADGARTRQAAVAAMVEVLGLNDATDPGGAADGSRRGPRLAHPLPAARPRGGPCRQGLGAGRRDPRRTGHRGHPRRGLHRGRGLEPSAR